MADRRGLVDVDAMLDGMTPEQWDEWQAFYILEPDPMDRIREVLKYGFATMCNTQFATANPCTPDMFDPSAGRMERLTKGEQGVSTAAKVQSDDVASVTPRQMANWALATLPGAKRR